MKLKMVVAAIAALTSSVSFAQTLTFQGVSDNGFQAWIANAPYIPPSAYPGYAFQDIALNNTPPGWNVLTNGSNNLAAFAGSSALYVLVKAFNNDNPSPAMFAASLGVTGNWQFSNGTQSLLTNTTNWEGINLPNGGTEADFLEQERFWVGNNTPTDPLYAQSVNSSWVLPAGATPIWTLPSGDQASPGGAIFATVLTPVTAVPEPEAYAMSLLGLGVLGFMARRRKQAAA